MEQHNIALIGGGSSVENHYTFLSNLSNITINKIDEDDVESPQLLAADAIVLTNMNNPQSTLQLLSKKNKTIFCTHDVLSKLFIDNLKIISETYFPKTKVGFKRRFDPQLLQLKQQMEMNVLGKIHIVKITSREKINAHDSNPFINNLHDFDMLRFLFNQEILHLFAMATNQTIIITLKMQNGTLITMDINHHCNYGSDHRIEVFGEQGALLIDNMCELNTQHFSEMGITSNKPFASLIQRYHLAYQNQLASFFLNSDNGPNLYDLLKAQQIAQAVYKSISHNCTVKLNEDL